MVSNQRNIYQVLYMFGILVFVQFWLIKMISGNRLNKFDEYVDLNILQLMLDI